jgi:endonuclease YncB( thermonuclease family)
MLRLNEEILGTLRQYPLASDSAPTEHQVQAIEMFGLGYPPDDMTFAEASALLTARSAAREVLAKLGREARITRAVLLQLEPYVIHLILSDRQVLFELIDRNKKRWSFFKQGSPPPTQRTRDTVVAGTQRLINGVPFAFHNVHRGSNRTQNAIRMVSARDDETFAPAAGSTGSFKKFIRSILLAGSAKHDLNIDEESDVAVLPAKTKKGRVSVIDGDTIEMHGEHIRIWGIDAPEAGQLGIKEGRQWRCGHDCAQALAGFLGSNIVDCVPRDIDEFGRVIAQCSVNGRDVGAWMVRNGWALDYKHFSGRHYAREQRDARNAKRGLWQGEFELPWKWRVRSRWLLENYRSI